MDAITRCDGESTLPVGRRSGLQHGLQAQCCISSLKRCCISSQVDESKGMHGELFEGKQYVGVSDREIL